jgi:hypothetical protein
VDVDLAGDVDNRKSTTGIVYALGGTDVLGFKVEENCFYPQQKLNM